MTLRPDRIILTWQEGAPRREDIPFSSIRELGRGLWTLLVRADTGNFEIWPTSMRRTWPAPDEWAKEVQSRMMRPIPMNEVNDVEEAKRRFRANMKALGEKDKSIDDGIARAEQNALKEMKGSRGIVENLNSSILILLGAKKMGQLAGGGMIGSIVGDIISAARKSNVLAPLEGTLTPVEEALTETRLKRA